MDPPRIERRYWNRNLRLTAALLSVWFVVTFAASWYARELSFNFFGWPFSFYVAAQGAPFVYLLIVAFYARRMDRYDSDFEAEAGERR
jgi:putative solute:sodium symporter small subunit